MGEWLSRKIGRTVPPFEDSAITGKTITHPRKPVMLWTGNTVTLTVRGKEHVLVFHVAEKKLVSERVRCTFPYDPDEIMTFGHTLSDQIPEQPALANFPAQPWPDRVHITVKRTNGSPEVRR
jgi:hypothetical protein